MADKRPPPVKPSPFLPPHRAVEAQLQALQSCDWPEEGSGVRCAWEFAQRRAATLFGAYGEPFTLRAGATDPSVLEARPARWPSARAACADVLKRTQDRIPLPAAAENRHLVLGWVPRRTRLRAPDQDFARFAATLNAPPYSALLCAEQCVAPRTAARRRRRA